MAKWREKFGLQEACTEFQSQYQAHANWVCALDLVRSDDGDEVLVSGGRGGVVKLWDVESFGAIGDLQAHSSTVNCIASNNSHIFTASRYVAWLKLSTHANVIVLWRALLQMLT